MDKYIKPNILVFELATNIVSDLRNVIRNICKLEVAVEDTKISLNSNYQLNKKAWLPVLSFLTRKINAECLGDTDYDYDCKDISFTLVKRGENE